MSRGRKPPSTYLLQVIGNIHMTGEQPYHQTKKYFEAGLVPLSLEQPLPFCHRARQNCYFHHSFEPSAGLYITESISRQGSTHRHVLRRTTTGRFLAPEMWVQILASVTCTLQPTVTASPPPGFVNLAPSTFYFVGTTQQTWPGFINKYKCSSYIFVNCTIFFLPALIRRHQSFLFSSSRAGPQLKLVA